MTEEQERFSKDKFPNLLGINLLELREGHARLEMNVEEKHLNFLGIAHGGAIFSLADTALGLASNSYGKDAVALTVNINFTGAAQVSDKLRAEVEEENRTKRTVNYRVRILTGDDKLVATAMGISYFRS